MGSDVCKDNTTRWNVEYSLERNDDRTAKQLAEFGTGLKRETKRGWQHYIHVYLEPT